MERSKSQELRTISPSLFKKKNPPPYSFRVPIFLSIRIGHLSFIRYLPKYPLSICVRPSAFATLPSTLFLSRLLSFHALTSLYPT